MSILDSVSPEDKRKLDVFMEAAKKHLQEIDDCKESLRDLAKHIAEELGIKPKSLIDAARTAHKNNLSQKQEEMAAMENVLIATGHG